MVSTKVVVSVLAIGASSASVAGYMYVVSGKKNVTVIEKIKESLKKYHRILISKDDVAWQKFKEVYKHSGSNKIPNISEDRIGSWCEDTLREVFSEEKYGKAMAWCVVYDRALKDTVSKTLLSTSGNGVEEKWKNAWERFNKENDSSEGLKISDTDLVGDSKPTQKEQGGPALNKWCTSKYEIRMYELGAEDLVKKVEKWCNTDAGNPS